MTTSKVAPEPAEMQRAASSSSVDMSEIATGDALLLEGAFRSSGLLRFEVTFLCLCSQGRLEFPRPRAGRLHALPQLIPISLEAIRQIRARARLLVELLSQCGILGVQLRQALLQLGELGLGLRHVCRVLDVPFFEPPSRLAPLALAAF